MQRRRSKYIQVLSVFKVRRRGMYCGFHFSAVVFLVLGVCYCGGSIFQMGIFLAENCDSQYINNLNGSVTESLAHIRHLNITPSVQYSFIFYPYCSPKVALAHLDEVFNNWDEDVVIGLAEYNLHKSFAIFSEVYGKPYIAADSYVPIKSNGNAFTTFPSFYQIARAFSKILDHFEWQTMTSISSEDELWQDFTDELHIQLSLRKFILEEKHQFTSPLTLSMATTFIKSIAVTDKVIVLCMGVEDQLTLLEVAANYSMGKDHAFFTFAASEIQPALTSKPQEILGRLIYSKEGVSIMESVFVVSSVFPRIHDPNSLLPSALNDTSQEVIEDAVFLVAYTIDNYLNNNAEPLNTSTLVSLMKNISYDSHLGRITIKGDGLVMSDYHVFDYNVRNGNFSDAILLKSVGQYDWTLSVTKDVLWPEGKTLDKDVCFKQGPACSFVQGGISTTYIIVIIIAAFGVIFIVIVIVMFIRRHVAKKEMTRGPNKILLQPSDLTFLLKKEMGKGSRSGAMSKSTILDKPDILRGSEPNKSIPSLNELSDYTEIARYNGDLVHVKELRIKGFEVKSKTMTQIRTLRDLRHENLNPYVGLLVDPIHAGIISEYCNRGSLEDVINNEDIKLDWDFKLSLLSDLVRGLRYIHGSTIKCHGNLKSRNCVIDSRWQLRITDYGLPGFLTAAKQVRDLDTKDLLWTAPEHLRDPYLQAKGSEKGDIFALGIILQEAALRSVPYSSSELSYEEILAKVKKPPPLIRPSVSPQVAPPIYIQTMKQCWSEIPDMRPSIVEVYDQFKKLTGGKKANIVDTMFRLLEKYSNDLEDIVADRTNQLEEEKKKTNQLLYRMLPPIVAENLKTGRRVEAESFNEVTIYFSDIVGFTTISAMSTPMQVVDLLNDLYTMFDATIDVYDVYKVETIGDAYMVSSGLPVRNGNRHAGEVGTMALDLLSQCGKFTIRHMPDVPLRVRIGLHTGSAVAGVVGLTMPRYCLFGDTVNTASRMESTGLPFRIHISQQCKDILDSLGGYIVSYRGQVELKGKGHHSTYWLVGKEGFDKQIPEAPELAGDNHGLASLFPAGTNLPMNPPASPARQIDPSKSAATPTTTHPENTAATSSSSTNSTSDTTPSNPPNGPPRPSTPKAETTSTKSNTVSPPQSKSRSNSMSSSKSSDPKLKPSSKSPVPDERLHYRRNTGGGTSRHNLANRSMTKKKSGTGDVSSESSKPGDKTQELEMDNKSSTSRDKDIGVPDTSIDKDNNSQTSSVVAFKDASKAALSEASNGGEGSVMSPRTRAKNHKAQDVTDSSVKLKDERINKRVDDTIYVENARNNEITEHSKGDTHCDTSKSGVAMGDRLVCEDSDKVASKDGDVTERTNVSVVSASDVLISGDEVINDPEVFPKDTLTPVEET